MVGRFVNAATPAFTRRLKGLRHRASGREPRRPSQQCPHHPGSGGDDRRSLVHPHLVWGYIGQRPEITHATSPAVSKFQTPGEGGEPWRNLEKARRERRAAGYALGHSRGRAVEKAASARVAANGGGLELDQRNQAPRFPSTVSRTLTSLGGKIAGAIRKY